MSNNFEELKEEVLELRKKSISNYIRTLNRKYPELVNYLKSLPGSRLNEQINYWALPRILTISEEIDLILTKMNFSKELPFKEQCGILIPIIEKYYKRVGEQLNLNGLALKRDNFTIKFEHILGDTAPEKIWNIFHFNNTQPYCECGKKLRFVDGGVGYNKFCSSECAAKSEKSKEKAKQTCITNWNVDNASKSPEIIEKIKQTCIDRYQFTNFMLSEGAMEHVKKKVNEKYGVDNVMFVPEIKAKKDAIIMEKYNALSPAGGSIEVREKMQSTCLIRFGYNNPFDSPIIREKIRQTNILNLGVPYPMMSPDVRTKSIETCMERYKVSHPAQSKELREKYKNYGFKYKPFILPSGKTILLQGYEPFVLTDLLLIYDENDIINEPEISYIDSAGKQRKYFPDFYIQSENKIIEVKSSWTMQLHLENNLLKAQSCIDLGYNFEFDIRDEKGVRLT